MRSPRELLPVYVQCDVRRYLSYGWKISLIHDIIVRRHGYHLTGACIRALRDGAPCPSRCAEACWLRRDGSWPHTSVSREELNPEPEQRRPNRSERHEEPLV